MVLGSIPKDLPVTAPKPSVRRPREYSPAGGHAVQNALPTVIPRAADPAVPDAELTSGERAAREFRLELLADLGGDATAAQRSIVDSVVGSVLILGAIDSFLATSSPINRRDRCVFRVVEQRETIATGIARRLSMIGMKRRPRDVLTLDDYAEARSEEDAS